MEIFDWRRDKRKNISTSGMMVRLSPEEAIILIRSLSVQLMTKNPNSERHEFFTKI